MTDHDAVEHWRYLFSIAYRMLGSVQEAEDALGRYLPAKAFSHGV